MILSFQHLIEKKIAFKNNLNTRQVFPTEAGLNSFIYLLGLVKIGLYLTYMIRDFPMPCTIPVVFPLTHIIL